MVENKIGPSTVQRRAQCGACLQAEEVGGDDSNQHRHEHDADEYVGDGQDTPDQTRRIEVAKADRRQRDDGQPHTIHGGLEVAAPQIAFLVLGHVFGHGNQVTLKEDNAQEK